MRLEGKNAVITGCMRGIGNDTMASFAREGANIWACCQCESDSFSQQISALSEEYGVWIKPLYFDLLDESAIKASMKQVFADKLPVDALVNIAGMTHNALFHMTPIDTMRKVFEVDFFSQMLISQLVSKWMIRKGGGSIVNISSIAGLDGNAGQIAYSAAKGALISATKTMAMELGPKGVRVNAIAPGVVDTAMTRDLSDDLRAELIAPSDLPRMGDAAEIAEAIIFLASDESSFITAQTIRVDGGIGGLHA